jgi:hypothetical protein
VLLGREMLTHLFSYSGGPGAVYIKSTSGHVTPFFSFFHPIGYVGHIVHSGASGA